MHFFGVTRQSRRIRKIAKIPLAICRPTKFYHSRVLERPKHKLAIHSTLQYAGALSVSKTEKWPVPRGSVIDIPGISFIL